MAGKKLRTRRQRAKRGKKSNIQNNWNAKIDRTKTVIRLGRNHVLYEYILPFKANSFEYYNEAMDVRSHKSATTKYNNGKKPGQYQPVGDKSYFTFYEYKKMRERGETDDYIEEIEDIVSQFYNNSWLG